MLILSLNRKVVLAVVSASLLLVSVGPVAAHNAADALANDRAYSFASGADYGGGVWKCDKVYRAVGNPEDGGPLAPFAWVPSGLCPGYSGYGGYYVDQYVPSVVITPNNTIRESFDCRIKLVNAAFSGSMNVHMRSNDRQPNGQCPTVSWGVGATEDTEYAVDKHMTLTHNAITPWLFVYDSGIVMNTSGTETVLESRLFAYYTGGTPLQSPIGLLKDAAKTDTFASINGETIRQWNISDPGGDDRLIVGGLDVTPSVGGIAQLDTATEAKRADAGSGNVIWQIKSTVSSEYLMVEPNYLPASIDWQVRAMVA